MRFSFGAGEDFDDVFGRDLEIAVSPEGWMDGETCAVADDTSGTGGGGFCGIVAGNGDPGDGRDAAGILTAGCDTAVSPDGGTTRAT
jgi:hypothetical protein